MNSMAEVIAAHIDLAWEHATESASCTCGLRLCHSTLPIDEQFRKLYAHVADELAKAGYGKLAEAQVEAWSEGWAAGLLDASIPGRKESTNPYREASKSKS